MARLPIVAVAFGLVGCGDALLGHDPAAPVAPLPSAGPPGEPTGVRVHAEPVAAFTLLATDARFRLALSVDDAREASGRPARDLGLLRSSITPMTIEDVASLECGWRARGAGDRNDYCGPRDALAVREAMRPRVEHALDELRTQAARAGAPNVERAACFSTKPFGAQALVFWCEGVATVPVDGGGPGASAEVDPELPHADAQAYSMLAPARWVIGAEAEAGAIGRFGTLGAKVLVRHRPFEAVFDAQGAEAPAVGVLSLGAFVRPEIGRSGFGVLGGGSVGVAHGSSDAMLVTPQAGVSWQLHATRASVEPIFTLAGGFALVATGSTPLRGPSVMAGGGFFWPEAR